MELRRHRLCRRWSSRTGSTAADCNSEITLSSIPVITGPSAIRRLISSMPEGNSSLKAITISNLPRGSSFHYTSRMCSNRGLTPRSRVSLYPVFGCRRPFRYNHLVWRIAMINAKLIMIVAALLVVTGVVATAPRPAADIKVADPTSVVMIVNRDSNDIAFMDIKSKKIVGRTFLGNNVNPHMVMMSPDGRYVVTGGTRANKAYIIDARTLELVKVIPVDIAPEHLAFSPDGRWYYQGNPEGDSISVIDMVSLTKVKTIPGLKEPLNVTFLPDGSKAYVGNYGAHWVGVIDVRRHELLKKIQISEVPGVAKLDPDKYLGDIKGINIPQITNDGKFLYATDTDLGVVAKIDPREDKVVKVIRVGKEPWRPYMS